MRLAISSLAAVLGSLLVACAGTPADDAATSEGAATSPSATKLTSGHFDEIDLVVSGTEVSGAYFSHVGDPAHGGATCSFTFSGSITAANGVDRATISAVDGWDTTSGTLTATTTNGKAGITITTKDLLNACMRSSPVLADVDGVPEDFTKKLESGVSGYATIGAAKAFFYDRAGGSPRAAYVLQGDTIVETGAATNGFIPAKFVGTTTTTGYIRVADIAVPAPAPAPAASPLVGKFELKNGAGIEGGFEVTSATDSQIGFNLTAVTASAGHHIGDIETATAPLANGIATYAEDDASCSIAFKFDATGASADVTQTGACGDFGAFVDVTGHYVKH